MNVLIAYVLLKLLGEEAARRGEWEVDKALEFIEAGNAKPATDKKAKNKKKSKRHLEAKPTVAKEPSDAEVNISPKKPYFFTDPKIGPARESRSPWLLASNISARSPKKAIFLHIAVIFLHGPPKKRDFMHN